MLKEATEKTDQDSMTGSQKKNQTKHRKITWTASIRELPFKKQNFPGWKRRWKKADKEENMFPGAVVSYIVPLHYCKMNIQ